MTDHTLADEKVEATFRNGSLTAISVLVGFSLSFLNRWAATPGTWHPSDLVAVVAISAGILLQISSVVILLSVRSLLLRIYSRATKLFLIGLAFVVMGVAVAIGADVVGYGQRILGS